MATILRFKSTNFKRTQLAVIKPEGPVVSLQGKNASGKSSIIDAIKAALGGRRHTPSEPIRRGAKAAVIDLDLGEFTVHVRITPSGEKLELRDDHGKLIPNPRKFLAQKVGPLSFDPQEFARQKPAAQAEMLRTLTGLDTAALDKEHDDVFSERTAVNREVKSLEARFGAMKHHKGAPKEKLSVSSLLGQIDELTRANEAKATAVRELDAMRVQARSKAERISELRAELETLESELADANAKGKTKAAEVQSMPEHDVSNIRKQIDDAERINKEVDENTRRDEVFQDLTTKRGQAEAHTDRLAAIDAEKAELIAEAKFPIEGLAIENDVVTYKGVPFSQASTAEQIRVSTAIGIALNPELPIIQIRDGSLLDAESLAAVHDLAEEHGAQIWIESVADENDGSGIYIEDGTVVGAGAEEAAE